MHNLILEHDDVLLIADALDFIRGVASEVDGIRKFGRGDGNDKTAAAQLEEKFRRLAGQHQGRCVVAPIQTS